MKIIKQFKEKFASIARRTSRVCGDPTTFIACICIIMLWSTSGPFFHFDNTWQLIINTGTTIITFLMVFLIQNSQNRDAEAMQIKLDELIRGNDKAHNILLDLESLSIEELDRLKLRYKALAEEARKELKENGKDIMVQEIQFNNETLDD